MLQYCFAIALIFDHIKMIRLVQKHVDKCPEYQFIVKNSFRKKIKIGIVGIQIWALSLEVTELNQETILTVA